MEIRTTVSYPIVAVEWIDSSQEGDWIEMHEVISSKPFICHTTGYLLAEDENYLTITSTYAAHNGDASHALGRITIPKVAILTRN